MAERAWIIRHGCFASTLASIAFAIDEWRLCAPSNGKRASGRRLP
jgi:hypothetical protein